MTHSREYLDNLLTHFKLFQKEQGITQRDLAEEFGITRSHFNKVLNGKTMPSLYLIEKIEQKIKEYHFEED